MTFQCCRGHNTIELPKRIKRTRLAFLATLAREGSMMAINGNTRGERIFLFFGGTMVGENDEWFVLFVEEAVKNRLI